MEKISEHITYKEATRSDVAKRMGMDNDPDEMQLNKMRLVANKVFEPLRKHFNVPIFISSFFRSRLLNMAIGGSNTSEHLALKGSAIDLDAHLFGGVTNKQLFEYIKNNLDFNQLIWEFGTDQEPDWVHVSYSEGANKKEILKATSINGVKRYIKIN